MELLSGCLLSSLPTFVTFTMLGELLGSSF